MASARAGLALYREHRGDRPVTALVYTHSHADHFGGSRAIIEDAHGGEVPVVAPDGFLYEAAAHRFVDPLARHARRQMRVAVADREQSP